jgi:hypothetical protein
MKKEKSNPKNILNMIISEAEKFSEFVRELPDNTKKISRTMDRADTALQKINEDMKGITKEIQREGSRLITGIIIAALLVSASLIRQTDEIISYVFLIIAGITLLILILSSIKDHLTRK